MANKREQHRKSDQLKPKISAMIWEFAGDFIRLGATLEERQSRLNAACSAWNMACNPGVLSKALDQYLCEYKRFNSNAGEAALAAVRHNMETLTKKKVEMFPDDRRQIVGARLLRVGDRDRIEAAAATVR